jgi:hypothetical protein
MIVVGWICLYAGESETKLQTFDLLPVCPFSLAPAF